jgi:hypothetical protein
VQTCDAGTKALRHPEVGDMDLEFAVLHLPDASGHRILTYTARPGTPSHAALQILAAHTATLTGSVIDSR